MDIVTKAVKRSHVWIPKTTTPARVFGDEDCFRGFSCALLRAVFRWYSNSWMFLLTISDSNFSCLWASGTIWTHFAAELEPLRTGCGL